jgi:predicted ABC-type ATPase
MIITLRGTNGAGKSTIVRRVMEKYDTITKVAYPDGYGRKMRPMGYICSKDLKRLFVPGHYEIPNGGIDTLPSLDMAYDMVLKHHELGSDVLYEGKNFQDSPRRIIEMAKAGLDIRVILVDLPVEACIAAVRHRGHNIKEATIRSLHRKSYADLKTITAANVQGIILSRQDAFTWICNWLALLPVAAHN